MEDDPDEGTNAPASSAVPVVSSRGPDLHIVFLHGLGQDGEKVWREPMEDLRRKVLLDVAESTRISRCEHMMIHLHILQAEKSPVTAFDGDVVPNWFDMPALPLNEEKIREKMVGDEKLRGSVGRVGEYIERELNVLGVPNKLGGDGADVESKLPRGLPPGATSSPSSNTRVVVGGFSQGGALALAVAREISSSTAAPIAGVFLIAGWHIPEVDQTVRPQAGATSSMDEDPSPPSEMKNSIFGSMLPKPNSKSRILWIHGTEDTPVPAELCRIGAEQLRKEDFVDKVEVVEKAGMKHALQNKREFPAEARTWLLELLRSLDEGG